MELEFLIDSKVVNKSGQRGFVDTVRNNYIFVRYPGRDKPAEYVFFYGKDTYITEFLRFEDAGLEKQVTELVENERWSRLRAKALADSLDSKKYLRYGFLRIAVSENTRMEETGRMQAYIKALIQQEIWRVELVTRNATPMDFWMEDLARQHELPFVVLPDATPDEVLTALNERTKKAFLCVWSGKGQVPRDFLLAQEKGVPCRILLPEKEHRGFVLA